MKSAIVVLIILCIILIALHKNEKFHFYEYPELLHPFTLHKVYPNHSPYFLMKDSYRSYPHYLGRENYYRDSYKLYYY